MSAIIALWNYFLRTRVSAGHFMKNQNNRCCPPPTHSGPHLLQVAPCPSRARGAPHNLAGFAHLAATLAASGYLQQRSSNVSIRLVSLAALFCCFCLCCCCSCCWECVDEAPKAATPPPPPPPLPPAAATSLMYSCSAATGRWRARNCLFPTNGRRRPRQREVHGKWRGRRRGGGTTATRHETF